MRLSTQLLLPGVCVLAFLPGCPSEVPNETLFGSDAPADHGDAADVATSGDAASATDTSPDAAPDIALDTAVDIAPDTAPDAGDDTSSADTGGASCTKDTQCPKSPVACRVSRCEAGACVVTNELDGIACAAGKACKNGSCLGSVGWAQDVVAGDHHSCALRSGGDISCWGDNLQGQLGDGNKGMTAQQNAPVALPAPKAVSHLAAGGLTTCAVQASGKAWCWGDNLWGQLANGTKGAGAETTKPVQIPNLQDFSKIAVGARNVCALRKAGEVWCWGWGQSGGLGSGDTAQALKPVAADISDVVDLALGGEHACAIKVDGTVWCWGLNNYGQCGNGASGDTQVVMKPGKVPGLTAAARLALGQHHSCVRTAAQEVWCWGGGALGQIGDGQMAKVQLQPLLLKLPKTLEIAAGYMHTCARTGANIVYCWGNNAHGQIGPNGGDVAAAEPVKLPGVLGAHDVTAGHEHVCMIQSDLSVWCWGMGTKGQLGQGAANSSSAPVKVKGSS